MHLRRYEGSCNYGYYMGSDARLVYRSVRDPPLWGFWPGVAGRDRAGITVSRETERWEGLGVESVHPVLAILVLPIHVQIVVGTERPLGHVVAHM